jgi:hypothetical protein
VKNSDFPAGPERGKKQPGLQRKEYICSYTGSGGIDLFSENA